INISGLALGITCFVFIMMYVKYELSYDAFHEKSDRIFRVVMHWDAWNFRGSSDFASTNGAMAAVLPVEFPEIEYAVRVRETSSSLKYEQKAVVENGIYADEGFFNTFTYPLTSGDPNTALRDPFSIVLTSELAAKLFGDEDPVGKALTGFSSFTLNVTGVCEDPPENSHLRFEYIVSFRTMYSQRDDLDTSWGILNYNNYVLLKEKVQYKEFEKKLSLLVDKYHHPEENVRYYYLEPITDIHLDAHINSMNVETIDRKYLYLFTTVAFLILIIAGVNYVNLATSRASQRSKEVGIRKTVGALRSELIKQFMGESMILTLIALIVSMAAVFIIHPYYGNFINRHIPLAMLFSAENLAGLIVLVFLVGLLSGFYPSILLSSFRPAAVLKAGKTVVSRQKFFNLRNILVVFQFFVAIILIVGTTVIYKQLHFIKNKDIGYDRDNIITIQLWNDAPSETYEVIQEELARNSNILSASISDRAPLRASENNTIAVESDSSGEMVNLAQVSHFYVDDDYVDVYKMKIKDGRNFSQEFPTDRQQGVVVNETLVRKLGLKDPVGKRIAVSINRDARIIGVAEDFHFASFVYEIGAAVFVYRPQWAAGVMSVKIGDGDMESTLSFIQSTFQGHIEDFVYDYQFVDERYNGMYSAEDRMGTLFTLFSMIAFMIAAIGLMGLISFIAAQKTKEIGIRKILGASAGSITASMIREFMILIMISSIIGLPISYLLMSNWLSEFAYRTDITFWTMFLSFMAASAIAVFSVILQVLKAAYKNPVDSLRYE
ncbi:ABC transporter permease, partial [candidate division KSB1 bacterium]